MSDYPSHLEFDEEPGDDQLSVLVGPDAFAVRAVFREDDERISVELQRVPFVGMTVFLVTFAALLTSAPLWLPSAGYQLPAHISEALLWRLAAMIWLLVVPSMVAIFWFAQRASKQLGPGALVELSAVAYLQ